MVRSWSMAKRGRGRGARAQLDAEVAAVCAGRDDGAATHGEATAPPSTDPALWTTRPVFGVAGGPVEVVLTDEGRSRAFSIGAQVRSGGPAEALEALWVAGGEGHLVVRGDGARLHLTDLGRLGQVAWGHLRSLGLVTSFQDHLGDGARLTDAGRRAAQDGVEERARLLDRCRRVAAWRAEPRVADEPERPRHRPRRGI